MNTKNKSTNNQDTGNRKVLSIRLKPNDIRRLDAVASFKDTTRTSIVEMVLRKYLSRFDANKMNTKGE